MVNLRGKDLRHTVAQAEEMYLLFWAAEGHSEANNGVSSSADRILGADTGEVERLMK